MPLADPFVTLSRRLLTPQRNYWNDPVGWVTDTLHEHLWSAQREVLESVRDHRYTAVQSCHDAGKSFTASRGVGWWLSTRPIGQAVAVTTAPTARQVQAILWKEIRRAHRKGGLIGNVLPGQPMWKDPAGAEIAFGRKPADHDAHGFQGIHDRYVLIVVDEACGIPKVLWDAIDALATNEDARVLAIGNPDDAGTQFKKICDPGSGWNRIRIDGLSTPNITAEAIQQYPILEGILKEAGRAPSTEPVPDDLRPMLISAAWVAERAQRWGTASSLWKSKVRGEFPDDSDEGVIPLGWIERAVDRWREWDSAGRPEQGGRRVVAVDVARFGTDSTCIGVRQGTVLEELVQYSGIDTMATADRVAAKLTTPRAFAIVDVIGIGAGVVDRLRQLGHETLAFNASEQAGRTDQLGEFEFVNNRSAAWWNLRELLDPSQRGGAEIMLPDDEDLKADLVTPKWTIKGRRIAVESKDEVRKRLGRSPDAGDMTVMAWWHTAGPVNSGDDEEVIPWGSGEDEDAFDPDDAVHRWG
ncbi:hypothetical protein ACIBSV_46815 [Embleya sp. NPDC050154]|uniref:hypothetical protein n=1 Tax=Embleya sp. NPDC050154 TaxID=3363988 RepID=UPI0037B5272E